MGSPRVGSNPTGVELMQLACQDVGGRLAEPWAGRPPEAGGNPAASWPRIGPGIASRLRSGANGLCDVGRHPGRPCASPGRWPYHGSVEPRGRRRSRLSSESPMNRPPRRYLRLRPCQRSRSVCVCVCVCAQEADARARRTWSLWPSGEGVGLLSRWGLPAWARIPQVLVAANLFFRRGVAVT